RRWRAMTRAHLDERLLDLVEPLQRLAPPARVCDKSVYSAFGHRGLAPWLHRQGTVTLIVTGGETDVCVLAAVMAAIDRGSGAVSRRKKGTVKSGKGGKGGKVKSRKQAIAIGLSEARKKGKKVPRRKAASRKHR